MILLFTCRYTFVWKLRFYFTIPKKKNFFSNLFFTLNDFLFQVNIFTGFCSGIITFAVLVVTVFLTNINTVSKLSSNCCKQSRMVLTHLFHSRNQQLLFLPSILGGLANGFIVGDFTSVCITYFIIVFVYVLIVHNNISIFS